MSVVVIAEDGKSVNVSGLRVAALQQAADGLPIIGGGALPSQWIERTAMAGVLTPDFTQSTANYALIDDDVVLAAPAGCTEGRSYALLLIRSGAGPVNFGWDPDHYHWPDDRPPVLSEDDGAVDVIAFLAVTDDLLIGVLVNAFTPDPQGGAPPGGSAGPIADAVHNPVSQTSSNTSSTSLVDVDASNLAVTFTPPASGNVKIVLEGMARVVDFSGSLLTPQCIWGLREGTTPVGSDQIALYATHYFDGSDWYADTWQRTRVSIYLTGLSGEKALKWAHRVPNTQVGGSLVRGGMMGPAIMEVWAA